MEICQYQTQRLETKQTKITVILSFITYYYVIILILLILESFANTKFKQEKPDAEDDYINTLQKQIYYLELEMKLMKDREIETKNKVGGYGKI